MRSLIEYWLHLNRRAGRLWISQSSRIGLLFVRFTFTRDFTRYFWPGENVWAMKIQLVLHQVENCLSYSRCCHKIDYEYRKTGSPTMSFLKYVDASVIFCTPSWWLAGLQFVHQITQTKKLSPCITLMRNILHSCLNTLEIRKVQVWTFFG